MGQFKEHYDFTNLPQFSMVPKGHQKTGGNYLRFPKIFMKLNEESVSIYNKQVEYFESVGMPHIIRTPSGGVSLRSIGWAYDSRRIGNAGFELTVTSWFSTYRLRLTAVVDDKDEASKIGGALLVGMKDDGTLEMSTRRISDMAIKQDGKRGRPIEWGNLFDKYNRKVNYWSRTCKTTPKDRIDRLDEFREHIISVREEYGLSSEQAVKLLGQQAGLGASWKQIDAYMKGARKLGITVHLKDAVEAFTPGVIRSETDIEAKLTADLGEDWNMDDLADAVYNGKITLNEANILLRLKFNKPEREDRAHWISQNIFGSK